MTTTQRNIVGASVLIVVLSPQPAMTAGNIFTVGDGTPQGCTEAALKDTLALAATNGGGTVQFACGPDPAAIILGEIMETIPGGGTAVLVLPDHTTIDGGGMITLSASRESSRFEPTTVIFLDQGSSATLENLGLTGGPYRGATGVQNRGILSISHCALFNISTRSSTGGAVVNIGALMVTNSTFTGDFGEANGGAIFNGGIATVSNSLFSGNGAGNRGGAIFNTGTFMLLNSTLDGNNSYRGGKGVHNEGTLTINNSTLSNNFGDYGGAIENASGSLLTIHHSEITANRAIEAGGINNYGQVSINNSTITGNTGYSAGGINILGGQVRINNSTITGNTANASGCGGITVFTGTLQLDHTEVTGNTPTDMCTLF